MKKSQNLMKPNTPDRKHAGRVQNRLQTKTKATTTLTGNSVVPGAPSNKHPGTLTRMSIAQNQTDITKQIESETNELCILYDKYLQTKIESLIVEKKVENKEKELLIGFASLARENENNQQKLHEFKIRKSEINSLNEIQKILDNQIAEITNSLSIFDEQSEVVLHQIKLLLNDIDHLACRNLKVPQVNEEMEKFQLVLSKSVYSIEVLAQKIGKKSLTAAEGTEGFETFVDTHNKLKKQLKTLDRSFRNLQVEVLTKTSVNLVHNQS